MKKIPCDTCGRDSFTHLFSKLSSRDELFTLVRCNHCSLVQVNPQPEYSEVLKYYSNEYFTRRSDRGYDNYYSDKLRSEIERVFQMNLKDLNFYSWEDSLGLNKSTIDIGCAAGYFVSFMKNRGWNARGIEIAEAPVEYGRSVLGLDIILDNFLSWDKDITESFDLITLWASIEHLHEPRKTLQKIYSHLKPGGRMILSTCRYGLLAGLFGPGWRFLNVPEHLYYYSLEGIIDLCKDIGFTNVSHITYGSGMTSQKNPPPFFNFIKGIVDELVKITDQGDMMALHFEKKA